MILEYVLSCWLPIVRFCRNLHVHTCVSDFLKIHSTAHLKVVIVKKKPLICSGIFYLVWWHIQVTILISSCWLKPRMFARLFICLCHTKLSCFDSNQNCTVNWIYLIKTILFIYTCICISSKVWIHNYLVENEKLFECIGRFKMHPPTQKIVF